MKSNYLSEAIVVDKWMNPLLKSALVSLFVLLIFFIAIPQNNAYQSLTISMLIFIWMFHILLIGLPTWRESTGVYLNYLQPLNIPIIFVIIPYILLLVSGGTQIETAIDLFLWYIIPTILFLTPEVLEKRIQTSKIIETRIIFNIIAIGILWIGFDNRYTNNLFSGFDGVGYTLNAIWMACIILVTFGRYVGIENPDNEHDKGIMPSRYGSKIANIFTLIASIIVIPFGLLTGFLQWNPQEVTILVVVISFIGISLTIALQEELVFRGILQNELTKISGIKSNKYVEYGVIIFVTALFALSHWNNDVPPFVYYYFITAFIAGLAYAFSYKKGGLFASILAHTMVDWLWALLLKRM